MKISLQKYFRSKSKVSSNMLVLVFFAVPVSLGSLFHLESRPLGTYKTIAQGTFQSKLGKE